VEIFFLVSHSKSEESGCLISDINSRNDGKKKKYLGRTIQESKKQPFKENDFNQTNKFSKGNKSKEVNGDVKEGNNKNKSVPDSELQYQSFSRENETELWASKHSLKINS
jgi:hypothetical protein